MRSAIGAVTAASLIAGMTLSASAESLQIPASADAMISHGVNAADPTGNVEYAEVGTRSAAQDEKKGYVRLLVSFDLDAIPQDATVSSATLRLRRAFAKEEGEGLEDKTIEIGAYRLMKPWGEGRPDGASWAWGQRKVSPWTKPGADATPADSADSPDRAAEPTATANALGQSHGVQVHLDVTRDVNAMRAGEAENHGWIIIGPEVDHGVDWVRFRTRENAETSGNAEYAPTLLIEYQTAAEAAAQGDLMQLRPMKGEVVPTLTKPSLLTNGDFDEGLSGWTVSKGDGVEAECSVVETEHGPALRIRRVRGDGPIRVVSDAVEVAPETDYLLTGLYHTSDASYGSLAELSLHQGARPDMAGGLESRISTPGRFSHVGHWTAFNRAPGEWVRKTRTLRTAGSTRYVRVAITVEGPESTFLFDNLYFGPPDEDNRAWSWPTREEPLPREQTVDLLQSRPDSSAEVRVHAGTPKLHIDGRPVAPQFLMADVIRPERGFVRDFGEHGIDVSMISLRNVWTAKDTFDLDAVDKTMWNAVGRNPEGYFVIYISARPYRTWHEDYPEHAAQGADGQYATSRHDHFAPPSYWSLEYQRQVFEMIQAVVRHINAQPYSRAVVGYFLTGGEDGQFYYQVRGQKTLQDGNAPGVSPLLAKWLRDRYPNVEDLRRAWGDDSLTYETARSPIRNERYPGTFFDPARQRAIGDFQDFLNEELARFLSEMGRVCKETSDKPVITGAYYGRGHSFAVYPHFAQTSVMFKSPHLDYMGAQPGYYGAREAGAEGHINWVVDSLRLHGKIPMTEQDFRTWVMQFKSLDHDFKVARYWNLDDLTGAVRREAGKLLSMNGGLWWMEMTGGWFHDPQIMAMLEQTHAASQALYENEVAHSPADIVFVTDESSFRWTNEQVNVWNGPTYHATNLQQRATYRAGLRFNHYYLSDLIERGMDNYKVYVFLNLYYPSEEARRFIDERLKRDGKVLVWQYAPGYLTDEGLSTRAMEALTGIGFATSPESEPIGVQARFGTGAPGGAGAKLLQGVEGRQLGYGVDLLAQRFEVSDPRAEVLAAYTSDGQPAAAVREFDDHTSVYIGHPSGMTPRFLQNLAQLGGVHAYIEPGDMFMHHRDDLIVLHGVEGGKRTLRLPFDADLFDAFTGETLATGTRSLPIELTPGETRWLRLDRR